METIFSQYKEQKSKHQDCLILMRDGDFYKAFDKDAKDLALATGVKMMTKGGFSVSIFHCNTIAENLSRLVRAGFKVAVCEFEKGVKA